MLQLRIVCVLLVSAWFFHGANLWAQDESEHASLSPSEFVSRVLLYSNEVQLIELEAQIAYQTKKLTWKKLVVPSFNLKLYPYGYDSSRVNTFISQYAPNPNPLAASKNPVIFSGLRPLGIDKNYHVFGYGLEFKTFTPFGGFFGFNFDNFFLSDFSEDHRQRIKFDFTLSQPLFVNNVLIDFRPFFNEFAIINQKYDMALVEKTNKRNQIIKGAYNQAYALITLTKQKDLLEKTVAVLSKDLRAMNVRLKNKLVSKVAVQSLELALSQQQQNLRDITSSYNDLRRNAQRMIAHDSFSLVMKEDEFFLKEKFVQERFVSQSVENNYKVRKKYLEYQVANKNIFSKEIESRPTVNFKLSLEPRYPQPRPNTKDFWKSFTDFSADGSTVDINFTTVFTIPLLTGFERKHRRMLDILSVEAYRKSYEQELADVRRAIQHQEEQYNDMRKKRNEIEKEVLLQRVFLDEKNIQLKQGTTSLQERLRQELKLIEALNKKWDVEQQMLLLALDVLDAKGVDLATLLK